MLLNSCLRFASREQIQVDALKRSFCTQGALGSGLQKNALSIEANKGYISMTRNNTVTE